MLPIYSSQLIHKNSEYAFPNPVLDLSKKMANLMESRFVAKQELNEFLKDNSQELSAFAIKTPVNWLAFSQSIRRNVNKGSQLSNLLNKLDRFLSMRKMPFSQLYPNAVRQNIASLYPLDQNNVAMTFTKLRQLLIGDYEYLSSFPKIQGIPLDNLVQWIARQKIPFIALKLDFREFTCVLPQLKYVDLSGYSDVVMSYQVFMLKKVSHLTCPWFKKEGIESLISYPFLNSLDLSRCNILDMGLEDIGNLNQLTSLNLSECHITDKGVGNISSLTNLKYLNISGCSVLTNTSIQVMRAFRYLESLNISECLKPTYKGLRHLSKCTNLRKLDVSACRISDKELKIIGLFTSLKTLNLSGCNDIKANHLEQLKTLTGLEGLNLSFLKIDDVDLTHYKKLKILNLDGCRNIRDRTIQNLNTLSISILQLRYCSNITDNAFVDLRTVCRSIHELDLTGCYKITDDALRAIGLFQKLTYLSIKGCSQVTDRGLDHLAYLCNLKYLNLQGTNTSDVGRGIITTILV